MFYNVRLFTFITVGGKNCASPKLAVALELEEETRRVQSRQRSLLDMTHQILTDASPVLTCHVNDV